MENSTTYSVICNGQLGEGFDSVQVQQAFADAFKISLEQAGKIVGTKRVLKKGLDLQKAHAYKNKLESLGLVVSLKANAANPAAASSLSSLSLIPIDGESESAEESLQRETPPAAAPENTNTVTCPKCNLEQSKAEQCAGCGVYLHKVLSQASPQAQEDTEAEIASESVDEETPPSDVVTLKSVAAAAGAALLGALVWKFIAVTFDYEHGLIAWGIGALVGFAAASMGSRGDISGAVCGVLALLAIFGGRYMAIDSLKMQVADIFETGFQMEEVQQAFDEGINMANAYVTEVTDDASLRQFMVDYELTEAASPAAITDQEISDFKEYVGPELESLAAESPSMDEFYGAEFQQALQQEMESLSTWTLLKESFGPIDILFVIFGVGTAFRLGRGQAV